jgi:hypothetical protein
MKTIPILVALIFAPRAHADVVRVAPESGAFVAHQGVACRKGFRETVLAVISRENPLTLTMTGESVVRGNVAADDVIGCARQRRSR